MLKWVENVKSIQAERVSKQQETTQQKGRKSIKQCQRFIPKGKRGSKRENSTKKYGNFFGNEWEKEEEKEINP